MKNFLIFGLFTLTVMAGCGKDDSLEPSGKSIDFYLLSEFNSVDNSFKIIDSTAKISDIKIISFSDIISYSSKTFTFTISDKLSETLNDFDNNQVHGTPFALTVDDEIVYTGYFWAGFSSMSCDWITIDPLDYSGKNELKVNLGYPGLVEGDTIPDKRNDVKIINTLRMNNKLVD